MGAPIPPGWTRAVAWPPNPHAKDRDMTQALDASTPATTPVESDLVAAVQAVLQASPEPMTLSKIRAKLPTQLRQVSLEQLQETLQRQVTANVLTQYPKYRSQHDRF